MIAACLMLLLGWTAAVPFPQGSLVTTLPGVEPSLTPVEDNVKDGRPDVYSLHVTSHIQYRYASTIVSSRVANLANTSKEVVFSVVLPETAFISGFLMEIDGKVYKAHIKEKEAAKKEYDEAIRGGQTAGHVAQSARNSNRFTVSVNVESQKKVTFNLTYEELLKRELSVYNYVVNIDPGQIVHDLSVDVNINESSPITTLEVTDLKENNEIDNEKTANNPLAVISRPSANTATIRWAPKEEEQRKLNKEGVKGQIAVRYDVDRTTHPEQILVNEGYFVHFFSPSDLATLRKHVIFVMDVSGSMAGRKIEQLREAMKIILDDLNTGDYFSLVIFSTDVTVWDPDHEVVVVDAYTPFRPWNQGIPGSTTPKPELREAAVVPATPENIKKAQDFVKNLQTYSSTNIYGGLLKGLELAHLGKSLTAAAKEDNKPEPIMIFLTDGEANVDVSDPEEIVRIVSDKNKEYNVSIFALEFGDYANSKFLKKLALRNSGFSRKIYEASDSALQLRDFYRLVSSPLLANVSFNYAENQVENGTLSQTSFSTFFRGSELVVAGKLTTGVLTGHLTAKTANGTTSIPFTQIIPLPFPPWDLFRHQQPERNYSDSSFMERLWAYLTIQQLLEKETAETLEGSNSTSPNKQKALDLALKYGFVTSLTSLVVVKPNETVSTDTEKGDVAGDVSGFGFSNLNSFSGSGGAGGFAVPQAIGGGFAGSFGPQRRPAPSFLPPATFPPLSTFAPLATFPPIQRTVVVPVQNLTWLPSVSNSTHITIQPDSTKLEETFLLGLNETDEAFSSCSSLEGEGHCRYLTHCALNKFTDDITNYYPFFCRIDNYAGVCCPDWLKPVPVPVA